MRRAASSHPHTGLTGSRGCRRAVAMVRCPDAGVAMAEGALERVARRRRAHVGEGRHGGSVPARRTVPVSCAPPIGSNPDSKAATLPKGGQRRKALRLARTLARAGEQPTDPDRRGAEQGAKPRPMMARAGQRAPTRATELTRHSHLGRHDPSLQRRRGLLRLGEPQPTLGHAGLPVARDAGNFGPRRRPGPQLRNQRRPPCQLRRQPTLVP